jgi:hypothetical protein
MEKAMAKDLVKAKDLAKEMATEEMEDLRRP